MLLSIVMKQITLKLSGLKQQPFYLLIDLVYQHFLLGSVGMILLLVSFEVIHSDGCSHLVVQPRLISLWWSHMTWTGAGVCLGFSPLSSLGKAAWTSSGYFRFKR